MFVFMPQANKYTICFTGPLGNLEGLDNIVTQMQRFQTIGWLGSRKFA